MCYSRTIDCNIHHPSSRLPVYPLRDLNPHPSYPFCHIVSHSATVDCGHSYFNLYISIRDCNRYRRIAVTVIIPSDMSTSPCPMLSHQLSSDPHRYLFSRDTVPITHPQVPYFHYTESAARPVRPPRRHLPPTRRADRATASASPPPVLPQPIPIPPSHPPTHSPAHAGDEVAPQSYPSSHRPRHSPSPQRQHPSPRAFGHWSPARRRRPKCRRACRRRQRRGMRPSPCSARGAA